MNAIIFVSSDDNKSNIVTGISIFPDEIKNVIQIPSGVKFLFEKQSHWKGYNLDVAIINEDDLYRFETAPYFSIQELNACRKAIFKGPEDSAVIVHTSNEKGSFLMTTMIMDFISWICFDVMYNFRENRK
jgi:hypothetical protein